MIHIKCVFGFCCEFPEFNIPSEELGDGQNDSIIHFIVYTYQGRCATHGIIKNGACVCIIYKWNYHIKIIIIKRTTYIRKKHPTNISCYIGELHTVHYQLMLNNYAYYGMLLCLIYKHK